MKRGGQQPGTQPYPPRQAAHVANKRTTSFSQNNTSQEFCSHITAPPTLPTFECWTVASCTDENPLFWKKAGASRRPGVWCQSTADVVWHEGKDYISARKPLSKLRHLSACPPPASIPRVPAGHLSPLRGAGPQGSVGGSWDQIRFPLRTVRIGGCGRATGFLVASPACTGGWVSEEGTSVWALSGDELPPSVTCSAWSWARAPPPPPRTRTFGVHLSPGSTGRCFMGPSIGTPQEAGRF